MLHSPTDYIDCLRYAGECCCNTISLPLETKALESGLAYIAASGDCIYTDANYSQEKAAQIVS